MYYNEFIVTKYKEMYCHLVCVFGDLSVTFCTIITFCNTNPQDQANNKEHDLPFFGAYL